MPVAGLALGKLPEIAAVGPDRADLKGGAVHLAGKNDAPAVWRPAGEVVGRRRKHAHVPRREIEDAQPSLIVFAPDAKDDLLAVRRIARKAGIDRKSTRLNSSH